MWLIFRINVLFINIFIYFGFYEKLMEFVFKFIFSNCVVFVSDGGGGGDVIWCDEVIRVYKYVIYYVGESYCFYNI